MTGYFGDTKNTIFVSDLDNAVCLCHEVGHYLIDKAGGIKKYTQSHSHILDGFKGWVAFLLGLTGFEVAGILTNLLLSAPTLYTEFMASYLGIKELEKAGGTKKEIEEAKNLFKSAWATYLSSAVGSGLYASVGKILNRTLGNK